MAGASPGQPSITGGLSVPHGAKPLAQRIVVRHVQSAPRGLNTPLGQASSAPPNSVVPRFTRSVLDHP